VLNIDDVQTNNHRDIKGRNSSTVDVADEPVNESKVWESWDEDDWMLFCRLNTKAARERLQAAEEGSSSNIRA
jgi:hypothetical protein